MPVTEAREDSQYRYTAAAADDDDGDELFYTADVLPSFMRFDPATQVISGTPLRGDVNCRSDQWHPAVDRCREGGFHLVRLAVSDYTFVVYQEFIVHVLPNDSPLLEADRSFHWPTLREINAVRVAAQRDAYHLRAGPALAAMALKANDATVFPWTARDPRHGGGGAHAFNEPAARDARGLSREPRARRGGARVRRRGRDDGPDQRAGGWRRSCRCRATAHRSPAWWEATPRAGWCSCRTSWRTPREARR